MHQEEDYAQRMENASLTEEEQEQLRRVMERAQEFDKKNQFNEPIEGPLQKWTNMMKGWQLRYFQLDPKQSTLHYHMSEDRSKYPPRGSLHLWGAEVAPSDEDPFAFQVNGSNGVTYKLRAVDTRERQKWLSHLRAVAANITANHPSGESPSAIASFAVSSPSQSMESTPTRSTPTRPTPRRISMTKRISSTLSAPSSPRGTPVHRSKSQSSEMDVLSLDPATTAYLQARGHQEALVAALEGEDTSHGLERTDKSVLMVKATAQATIHTLQDCLALLHLHKANQLFEPRPPAPPPPAGHKRALSYEAQN